MSVMPEIVHVDNTEYKTSLGVVLECYTNFIDEHGIPQRTTFGVTRKNTSTTVTDRRVAYTTPDTFDEISEHLIYFVEIYDDFFGKYGRPSQVSFTEYCDPSEFPNELTVTSLLSTKFRRG